MDFLKRLFGAKPANTEMNIPAPENVGAKAPKLPVEAAPNAVVGGKRRNTRRHKNSRNTRKNNRK
jgi:hypothetical protein